MSTRAVRAAIEAFAPLPIWVVAGLIAAAPINAVDFFWHLKLGALIAETHRIPTTDTFSSVHPDHAYVQLQWLWELGAHLVHDALGLRGIRGAQVALLIASFAALTHVARRTAGSAAALLVGALGLLLFEDRVQARPSSLVLGFVALSLPWLVAEVPDRSRRTLAVIAAVASIWSNLHGGEAILLPLCLLARTVGFAYAWRRGTASRAIMRASALQLFAATLGCLLSPTLLPGMRSWSEAIGPQLATGNQEWLPSYTMLRYGLSISHATIALAPSAVALVYVAYVARVPAARVPAQMLVAAGTTALAHHAVRNAFLCIVPLLFVLHHARPRLVSRAPRVMLATLGYALLVACVRDHVMDGYGGIAEARQALAVDLAPNVFPEELGDFLREAEIAGPLVNDGRWGGYLIATQWPRCTVFADSRQDFTDAMWQVMLASQSPDRRPGAMAYAFARWGLELSVFRGPTFPLVRPDPAWQLLFKAGDQELYQHRQGAHAAENLARARAWLTRVRGSAPTDEADFTRAIISEGAARWLAAPYRAWTLARAEELRGMDEPVARAQGLRIAGTLSYDAGDYALARTLLEEAVAVTPEDHASRYRIALASYALGDEAAARAQLTQLSAHPGQLSRHQRERLNILAAALRAR